MRAIGGRSKLTRRGKPRSSRSRRWEPAYLICTNPDLPLQALHQAYLWRWDIEVNFRDEKTILGVGQAQVRSERCQPECPRFGGRRLRHIIAGFGQNLRRYELWSDTLTTNFTGFSSRSAPDQNGIKCDHPLESEVFLSIQ